MTQLGISLTSLWGQGAVTQQVRSGDRGNLWVNNRNTGDFTQKPYPSTQRLKADLP